MLSVKFDIQVVANSKEISPEPERFPAQIIRPQQGTLLWRLLRLEQER